MGARQAIAAFAQGGDVAAASSLYLLTSCPDHSVSTAEAVTWGMGTGLCRPHWGLDLGSAIASPWDFGSGISSSEVLK